MSQGWKYGLVRVIMASLGNDMSVILVLHSPSLNPSPGSHMFVVFGRRVLASRPLAHV